MQRDDRASSRIMGVDETESLFTAPDGASLSRRSIEPPEPWARLALLHGYGDHSARYLHFLRWMAERGVTCHAFDFRGHGRSAGRRGYVRRWEDYLDDLQAFLALSPLRPDAPGGPPFVLGHSHGGLVVAAAVIRRVLHRNNTAGCILSAPYLRGLTPVSLPWRGIARLCNGVAPSLRVPSGLRETSLSADEDMLRENRADPLLLRTATPRWYLTTLEVQSEVMGRAGEFRLPLLCLVAGTDDIADPAAEREFVERAGSADRQVIGYPNARHELLRDVGRGEAFAAIHDWMRARVVSRA